MIFSPGIVALAAVFLAMGQPMPLDRIERDIVLRYRIRAVMSPLRGASEMIVAYSKDTLRAIERLNLPLDEPIPRPEPKK